MFSWHWTVIERRRLSLFEQIQVDVWFTGTAVSAGLNFGTIRLGDAKVIASASTTLAIDLDQITAECHYVDRTEFCWLGARGQVFFVSCGHVPIRIVAEIRRIQFRSHITHRTKVTVNPLRSLFDRRSSATRPASGLWSPVTRTLLTVCSSLT